LLELPKLNPGETVNVHHGYRFSFDQRSHLVRWVAYSLTPDKVRAKIATRSNKFTADRQVAGSAEPSDYEGSGYDRGHLAPAEDMRWSKESEDDSFYMTNMTPQKPKFNRGLWKKLETRVRKWAGDFDETYIVSGPVLDGKCLEKIARDICVPERFFKVILARSGATLMSIGFLMPQNYQDTNIADYATSVAQVERVTHLDFFAKLPKSTQQNVESQNDFESWPR
jgi:endonuclease G